MRKVLCFCLSATLLLGGPAPVRAEIPVWACAVEGDVLWQHTAAVGYLVACSKSGLYGIDVERGSVLWSLKELGGLKEDGLIEIAGAPYFMAEHGGDTVLVDGFTGVKVFSAKAEGFTAVGNRYPLYQCGGLLVTGKKGGANAAVMMGMKDGKKRWELSGGDVVFAAFGIDARSLLVVTAVDLYRLDAASGREIWKKAVSHEAESINKMGALGGLLKKVAESQMEKGQSIRAMELTVKPELDAFYLAVESKRTETSTGGQKQERIESSYNGYKLSDGGISWAKFYSHDGKLGRLMPSEGGLILFNGRTVNSLGYRDGKPAWGKKGQGLRMSGEVERVFKSDRGLVCVTDNAVNILDPKKGALLFAKDVKAVSGITDVRLLPAGLFVSSEDQATIIDLAAKAPLWDRPVKTTPRLCAVKGDKLYLYSTKDKTIYQADLKAKAALTAFFSGPVEFEGKEKPQWLEVRSNGLLLGSDQNVWLLSPAGKTLYKDYFPAPRDPGLLRALNYANAVRAAYYGAALGMVSADLSAGAAKTNNAFDKSVATGFGEATGQMSTIAFGAAGEAWRRASGRYKATAQTQDHIIVLTKTGKGCSLLRIGKADGKTVQTIDLGDDRKPVYSVDGVTGRIYYRPEPRKIVCYPL